MDNACPERYHWVQNLRTDCCTFHPFTTPLTHICLLHNAATEGGLHGLGRFILTADIQRSTSKHRLVNLNTTARKLPLLTIGLSKRHPTCLRAVRLKLGVTRNQPYWAKRKHKASLNIHAASCECCISQNHCNSNHDFCNVGHARFPTQLCIYSCSPFPSPNDTSAAAVDAYCDVIALTQTNPGNELTPHIKKDLLSLLPLPVPFAMAKGTQITNTRLLITTTKPHNQWWTCPHTG